MQKKKIFVSSQYLITDPPTKNVVDILFKNGHEVVYVQQSIELKTELLPKGVKSTNIRLFNWLPFHLLRRIVNSLYYKRKINRLIRKHKPDIIIAIMYQPISVIRVTKGTLYIAAILDIPVIDSCGKYDKIVFRKAFKRLSDWHLVWASDEYKAELIRELCDLPNEPIICYNCPPLNYFDKYNKTQSRAWIEDTLKEKNIVVDNNSMIILRAGAIGEYCGIEETIAVLKELPDNIIFIMIGRPSKEYVSKIELQINKYKLNTRVYIFLHPSDDEWKKFILGADIGHLIHTVPQSNSKAAKIYSLNSSLSNNRLYQYMAAGLPILSYNDERLSKIYKKANCFAVVELNNLEQSLKICVNNLYENVQERKRLGDEAIKAFLKYYNWESQSKIIINNISNLKN
jgi:glycosyltransferase involved in cell wall biosynthesis